MAKKYEVVATGRPKLLDGGDPYEWITLVPLTKTRAGNSKPNIEIRAVREADGWRGYPKIVKALDLRKRLQPMVWKRDEWREATPAESRSFNIEATPPGPSAAERETSALIDALATDAAAQ